MNSRKQGKAYEEIAANYLNMHGLEILEKNYAIRQGEIDLIALEEETLVFVEVKYRKDNTYGAPWESLHQTKQRRICRAAEHYCLQQQRELDIRYDVISICGEEIHWFKNAFFHQGRGY